VVGSYRAGDIGQSVAKAGCDRLLLLNTGLLSPQNPVAFNQKIKLIAHAHFVISSLV
jgi:hypothetical protein